MVILCRKPERDPGFDDHATDGASYRKLIWYAVSFIKRNILNRHFVYLRIKSSEPACGQFTELNQELTLTLPMLRLLLSKAY